ncbi:MAG: DUF4365 domain-containing protein [Myxococcota bacterium]
MTDALLSPEDSEEALSEAYVHAIAAGAGYTTSQLNFDRDGVDVRFSAGGNMRPNLDAQLKATIGLGTSRRGAFRFPLKLRNYNLLRVPTQVPRILIVLDLPEQRADWLSVSVESLILRKCAYWVSLAERSETKNSTSVTIDIPTAQVFDIAALKKLMESSRRGAL